ncbi:MAG: excinuclease ABC subunit UvrC [Candidatus Omnitrophica bacterium]|nr:excinuclease ABC subunit UvrC [Candidatus Omnitrophota bacterium]
MSEDKLKTIIGKMPDAPGVYLMKDAQGAVIYIGKAKSLKKRLLSYLSRDLASRTVALISHVQDIETRLTQTEGLALILEASLIHKFKPKYNVMLRDDKSFPWIKISNEEFPGICITRKREPDGSRYYGPYTSAKLLRAALKIIRKYFPYRSCKQLPRKACIYYRLGLSPAPCIGKISKSEYAATIENISLLLEGRTDALIKNLTQQMLLQAKEHRFEEAAKSRDQIAVLGSVIPHSPGPLSQMELEDLQGVLKLERTPWRIEAFDISNISGKEATGSMVSFYRGNPDKNNYRRFRIKTVQGVDDYKMLSEVVSRRYSRLVRENLGLPDLILIDGGKGHLLTAAKELEKLGLSIPLISIAKEHENIYLKNRQQPLRLSFQSPALNLIRRVRDEAHRFAVSYHHILRRKQVIGQ